MVSAPIPAVSAISTALCSTRSAERNALLRAVAAWLQHLFPDTSTRTLYVSLLYLVQYLVRWTIAVIGN